MLAGSVDAGDHTRGHPRVVQVRRTIHEGEVEASPDQLFRARQGVQMRVTAPRKNDAFTTHATMRSLPRT